MFPHAKFIVVKRNPINTARSIARFQPDTWYGYEDYKWRQLLKLYENNKEALSFDEEFMTRANGRNGIMYKALVEWALGSICFDQFVAALDPQECQRTVKVVQYEDLMGNTQETLTSLLQFVGLTLNDAVTQIAAEALQKRIDSATYVHQLEQQIETELLEVAGPDFRNFIYRHLRWDN